MTVTLDLPPNVEQAYLAAAQARGLPLEEIVREVVVAANPLGEDTNSYPKLSHEEWMRQFEAWGARNADKNLPILSNEDLRRENMYEDRGL
jgi:hypothetical protein